MSQSHYYNYIIVIIVQ